MNNALLAGVSGLSAFQKMLDVAGNNLANVSTTAFKASHVTFAELLGNTIRQASQPSGSLGGTNPQQVGGGVTVASIGRNMNQGNIENTGQALDMAIDGTGYFVLNDGKREVYTRAGSFTVDQDYYLVDPNTGARVQRIGSEGESEGFQSPTDTGIRVPYDMALPAAPTTSMNYAGNLSADEVSPTALTMTSGIQFTTNDTIAPGSTTFDNLQQGENLTDTDVIYISGVTRDGTVVPETAFDIYDSVNSEYKTLDDLLAEIQTLFPGSEARMVNGEIRILDSESGYSQTDVSLRFESTDPTASLELPQYFKVLSAGGTVAKSTNIEVYDSQGVAHTLSASFIRTNEPNKWDLLLTSITGDVELVDRRVNGITFQGDGAFSGVDDVDGSAFTVKFLNDPLLAERTIYLDFGTKGEFDGLSQFGGASTVAPNGQDGFAPGWLSSVSVSREGTLVGTFTNGIRKDVAALKLATFQNPAGLEAVGNNYFQTSANSGDAVLTRGMSGAAGAVRGGALEKSNVETAAEFVNMIQAQNGFQANARTITVANEMLRELTNLIR